MLIRILLLALIALVIVYIVFFITTSAIIFSRATLALLIAALMNGVELVQENSMLNFIAWTMVVYGVIHFISYLPRANAAIQFFSTNVISVCLIYIIATIVLSIFAMSGDASGDTLPLTGEVIIKTISLIISGSGLLVNLQIGTYDMAKNPTIIILERLFASFLYGVTIMFLFYPLGGNWEIPSVIMFGIFLITTAVTYFLDLKYAGKLFFTIPDNIIKVFPK